MASAKLRVLPSGDVRIRVGGRSTSSGDCAAAMELDDGGFPGAGEEETEMALASARSWLLPCTESGESVLP